MYIRLDCKNNIAAYDADHNSKLKKLIDLAIPKCFSIADVLPKDMWNFLTWIT